MNHADAFGQIADTEKCCAMRRPLLSCLLIKSQTINYDTLRVVGITQGIYLAAGH